MHREECDDGMPPESTTAVTSHTPSLIRFVNICSHREDRIDFPCEHDASTLALRSQQAQTRAWV